MTEKDIANLVRLYRTQRQVKYVCEDRARWRNGTAVCSLWPLAANVCRYLEFLSALCKCDGKAMALNQERICSVLFDDMGDVRRKEERGPAGVSRPGKLLRASASERA